jgi:hypothetical protein
MRYAQKRQEDTHGFKLVGVAAWFLYGQVNKYVNSRFENADLVGLSIGIRRGAASS